MSDKDVQERTEPPTSRRLRKLREKGSVAKSKDLASAAALASSLAAFCIAWSWYLDQLKEILVAPFPFLDQPFRSAAAAVATTVSLKALYILGPLFFVAIVLVVVAYLVQIGPLFSIHPILPKMERLNPAAGLKRMFSLPQLVEATKGIIKTLILGGALYYLLKDALSPLVMLPFYNINSVVQMSVRLMQYLFLVTMIVFISMSLVDVIVQKYVFLHENRMSKYDVKRDFREMEGDPLLKGRRKFLHTTINEPKPGDQASD